MGLNSLLSDAFTQLMDVRRCLVNGGSDSLLYALISSLWPFLVWFWDLKTCFAYPPPA